MEVFKPSAFNILMVDDNPKNLQLLGTTLRNEGYLLEFATSGQMALNWLEKKTFDIILLDIMMPEMSGFEVCEYIRKNKDWADMPIIFLTAKTEKESIVQGFKLGAQDYITKPFDSAELLARVRTHLELRRSKALLKNMNEELELKVQERTQELRIANEQLQRANGELVVLDKAKSEFLHIIAHEIRTPLNGIRGSIDIMKELYPSNTLNTLFHILEASVGRLEKFSSLALKITQLKIGKYSLDIQQLPCSHLLNTSITKYSHHLENKHLKLTTNIDIKEEIIEGDFELISNCLSIILDNAIKYTPEEGNISIHSYIEDSKVYFSFEDEGPGFSEKALQNLFKLFVPGEKHVNENEGLELAMAKLAVEIHKGEIKIENKTKGAKVTVCLPLNAFE